MITINYKSLLYMRYNMFIKHNWCISRWLAHVYIKQFNLYTLFGNRWWVRSPQEKSQENEKWTQASEWWCILDMRLSETQHRKDSRWGYPVCTLFNGKTKIGEVSIEEENKTFY